MPARLEINAKKKTAHKVGRRTGRCVCVEKFVFCNPGELPGSADIRDGKFYQQIQALLNRLDRNSFSERARIRIGQIENCENSHDVKS